MADRNYVAEMRERIDSWQDGSDESAKDLAAKLYKDISENDADLIAGWTKQLALSHLARAFHERRGSARQQERRAAGAELSKHSSVFGNPDASEADRAEALAAMERLTTFEAKVVVNDDGETKSIGRMTGPDNLFVSRRFGRSSKRDGLLAQFYLKVAEKVGDRTVEDVFSVAAYAELRASITGVTTVEPAA
jgi:hypothetical protein